MAEENSVPNVKPSRIKRAAKFMFDVPAWLGVSNIVDVWGWTGQLINKAFSIPGAQSQETFEASVKRQQLTEEDLKKQEKVFLWSSVVLLFLGILSMLYTVHLWYQSSIFVVAAAVVVTILFFLKSYFYSFWCFQIKTRQLGRTFKAWLQWILRGQQ